MSVLSSLETEHLELDVRSELDAPLAAEWDALLSETDADTIFLTSAWLRAWKRTLGRNLTQAIVLLRSRGRLLAAGAFASADEVAKFSGTGPSDYADVLVHRCIDPDSRVVLTGQLLAAAEQNLPRISRFELGRIKPESGTLVALERAQPHYFSTVVARVPAPYLDMSQVGEKLRKKSLLRHQRGLERAGSVVTTTQRTADDILPQLDDFFFDQHVRRWEMAGIDSPFKGEEMRAFYREVARELGPTGQLRFTCVRLCGRPVAAHFGFHRNGCFTWYKPTFEPTLAKQSPGEVLLKHLLESARDEGAQEFDFTIGDERFKHRFATGVRQVAVAHVTGSRVASLLRRGRSLAGNTLRKLSGR